MDVEKDVEGLYKAMVGLGTDEAKIIKIVTNTTNEHRQKLIKEYQKKYNKSLLDDLSSELSFNFKESVLSTFYTPLDFYCYHLNKALNKISADINSLIEILAASEPSMVKQFSKRYNEMYKNDLISLIKKKTSGDLQTYLVDLASGVKREELKPDEEKCKKMAEELRTNSSWDNKEFIKRIFIEPSPEEIKLIIKHYHKLTYLVLYEKKLDMFQDDNVKFLIKTITHYGFNAPEYFANQVHKAIEGFGTDDTSLIRILVSRDEIDMPYIKVFYKKLFNADMLEDVSGDTSGDYREFLLELAGH